MVKNKDSPAKNYGFDEPLPDGIPSLSEYLLDYCAAAVSCSLLSFLVSELRLGTKKNTLWRESLSCRCCLCGCNSIGSDSVYVTLLVIGIVGWF